MRQPLATIVANNPVRPRLVDVYPQFREQLQSVNALADTPEAAAEAFARAQLIAQAFWAGVNYACGADND